MSELIREQASKIAELEDERDDLQRQVNAWVAANAPGGWIDVLRVQNQELLWAVGRMYEWAHNWDSEFMNDPDWKNKDYPMIQEIVANVKGGAA